MISRTGPWTRDDYAVWKALTASPLGLVSTVQELAMRVIEGEK